jgi:hypothetical protein
MVSPAVRDDGRVEGSGPLLVVESGWFEWQIVWLMGKPTALGNATWRARGVKPDADGLARFRASARPCSALDEPSVQRLTCTWPTPSSHRSKILLLCRSEQRVAFAAVWWQQAAMFVA